MTMSEFISLPRLSTERAQITIYGRKARALYCDPCSTHEDPASSCYVGGLVTYRAQANFWPLRSPRVRSAQRESRGTYRKTLLMVNRLLLL